MTGHLAVLGGGSPYTAALADAIADREPAVPPGSLVLAGRDPDALDAVGRYVRRRLAPLGWTTTWTTQARAALRGAGIVIHQIRYGGIAGRQRDEDLALACGLVADETLGPGALQAALRLRDPLDETCVALVQECPTAAVLNLTNPLSLTTARMIQAGVSRCMGLCELPRVTLEAAAAVLGEDPERACWAYAGLNHRGFIVRLEWDGVDRVPDLARRLGAETLNGIRADEIAALQAIPTKYFRLMRAEAPAHGQGRASFLTTLRARILEELRADSGRSPPSLRARDTAWYPRAVVPAIEALRSRRPVDREINVLAPSGVVEEGRARIDTAGAGPLLPARAPAPVEVWLAAFRDHERCLLEALERPSLSSVRRALEADPLVPAAKAEACARLVWACRQDEASVGAA
ncbi:6-phospho-beta-glucosidase [Methylobacterium currus]|uniref:family 4 glycosyl hydrolase n=1 Tax=Methylobacterium currus TaxID=2051553 RepID=UPI0013DF7E5D|nr:6-phospho-beta-glucosidase [Methylobacterium currus]